jgi:UDP-N-acetylmuramate dehydrogenase
MSFQLHSKITVFENEPLGKHTSFKIGGNALLYAEPLLRQELFDLCSFAQEEDLPVCIIGNGTNVLCADEGYPGLVVSMRKFETDLFSCDDTSVHCSSGITTASLVHKAKEYSCGGFSFLAWIPGTLGGAIMRNASYKMNGVLTSIGDILQSVSVFDPVTQEVKIVKKDALIFSYRRCSGVSGIILDVSLSGVSRTVQLIDDEIAESLQYRKNHQDIKSPSVGCIFKNPNTSNYTAGQLIDMCGLKGETVGGARISDTHANFILNVNHATARDVLSLIELIKQKVNQKFGINLELEVEYIS